jgi:hypothetical protein
VATPEPERQAAGPAPRALPEPERQALTARPRAAAAPKARARERAAASWQALGESGHFGPAYEQALRVGFEAECERVAEAELLLLGDIARLNGDAQRARQAYASVRRRFGGSAGAARAAFALGRLAVETNAREAMRWFETYLSEQPDGPLAPAALDWIFELEASSGDLARRRDVARTYLERNPAGAHAGDARRILDGRSAP